MFQRKKSMGHQSTTDPPYRAELDHQEKINAAALGKELSQLRAANSKLVTEADKYRIAFENEHRKNLEAETAIKMLDGLRKSLEEAQEKILEYELRLSDFDAQFWFFWSDLPKYAADSWLEKWQRFSPEPIKERLARPDKKTGGNEK